MTSNPESMEYKGYKAAIRFDDRDSIFHGHLVDTYDDVYFEGQSVQELEKAFKEAVDDYLSYCASINREPAKPFSGRINLRMDNELHRKAHIEAQRRGVSLNKLITDALSEVVE